ncbi:MAG: hypothetical protein Fur003_5400 [Candidatus Dojkabacteria bacterium]
MDDLTKTQTTQTDDSQNNASLAGLSDGDGYFQEDLAVDASDFNLDIEEDDDELGNLGFDSALDEEDDVSADVAGIDESEE